MLVLSRKAGESVTFPWQQITVVVNRITGNRVSLAISAPEGVAILRGELPQTEGDDSSREGMDGWMVKADMIF